jgi:tetratricopeptide (TPR) repeat protein
VAARHDAHAQIWRLVKAKVLARRGDYTEAERLARRAIEICEDTDMLIDHAQGFADLAEVLALAGRPDAAIEALEQALTLCERKEYFVMAEHVRACLAELHAARDGGRLGPPHISVVTARVDQQEKTDSQSH